MQIGDYTITDCTDRAELITIAQQQQQEIERLEDQVESAQIQIENLSLTAVQRAQLAHAADLLADQGRIFNTPQAKADWAAGRTAGIGYAQQ